MKAHSCRTTSSPSKLVTHNDSHTISKQKPKISIIHIVAPEIIKTDVNHFRELVQSLTGQPLERRGNIKKANNVSSQLLQPNTNDTNPRMGIQSAGAQSKQRMKYEREEIHGGENPNAFFSFLGDVDGFVRDMNEFPVLSFRSTQMKTFGEMPLR